MEENNPNNMKRPMMSLELNSGQKANIVKPKLNGLPANNFSMDPNTITTPDIEKILLPMLPTPSINNLANPMFTQQNPPNEKEEFSMGFMQALQDLHKQETNNICSNQNQQIQQQSTASSSCVMNGGSFTYNNPGQEPFPVVIKDEPSLTSPPPSPIDMETQEKIKLERKRQRNRVAASKCRKRKLERISKLDDKVKCLKGENAELGGTVKALKEQISQLKQKVLEHFNAGCEVPVAGNVNKFLLTAK